MNQLPLLYGAPLAAASRLNASAGLNAGRTMARQVGARKKRAHGTASWWLFYEPSCSPGARAPRLTRKLVLLARSAWRSAINARPNTQPVVEVHYLPPRRADVSEVAVEENYHHMQPSVLVACGVQQNASLAIVNIFGPTLEDGAY
jgi:hypothetical protein